MNLVMVVTIMNFFIKIISCKLTFYDLNKVIKNQDIYQVTVFVSENYTGSVDFFPDIPTVTHSFHPNREVIPYDISNVYQSISLFQDSLVIFYASYLKEVKFFIRFFKSETFVNKKMPKCLIIMYHSTAADNDEISDVLKHAWQKKFLDFTIMAKTLNLIYYYNPFSDVVYKKLLKNQDVKIFPDKLRNAHGYPFNISYRPGISNHPNEIARHPLDPRYIFEVSDFFRLSFAARCLNFNVTSVNIYNHGVWVPKNFLKKNSLDVLDYLLEPRYYDYFNGFYVSADKPVKYIVAVVPIISLSRFDIFLKIFYILIIITVLILGFSLLYNYFIQSRIGHIEAFDVVLMLLGQSMRKEPKKLLHRIIVLTAMIVSFIFTNDIISDVLSISFEKREVPFDTYEDLYKSKLQTYTYSNQLLDPRFHGMYIQDPHLLKVLKNTILVNDEVYGKIYDEMVMWKNVSLIGLIFGFKNGESPYYSSDGYGTSKIAQPPIFTWPSPLYRFADNSPFGMKFLEIMRRIKETELMQWPVLVGQSRKYRDYTKPKPEFDTIKLEHLLTVLSAGYLISIVFFVLEFVYSNFDDIEKSIKCRVIYLLFLFFYYKNKLRQEF